MKRFHFLLALTLIAAGVSLRLMQHAANFAPMTAIALFGGAVLPRRWAVAVPLSAMILSDIALGFYALMPLIWACYVIIALASSHWLQTAGARRVVMLALSASLFFYIVTNFGVWAASGMYAHTWMGLAECYWLALPFFRNSLLSDIVYTAGLFWLYARASAYGARQLV